MALWQSRNWPNNSGLLRRENIFGDRSYNTVEYIEVDDQTGYPDRSKYAKLLEEISVKEHCGPSSLHPSINTYTDYETNNVDALLAWDETSKNLYDQDSRQILAAVLSHTASSIVMRPIERTQYCWTNRDGTIACISECGRGKKFQEPVVIEQPTVALTNAKARNYYQIAWRKDRFTLYEKPAWISASNSGTPFYPNVYNTAPFPLLDYSLTATGRDLSSRELWGNTKSFQAKRFPLDIEVLDGVNHILLQPHMEWSEDFSVRGVSQPRLAEYMLIDQPAQSNIARRVYRKPDASQYSAITASAAHLMKSPAASDGLDNVQLYGYGTRSQRMCMEIRDQTDRPLQLGMLAESEVDGDSLAANSLVTNWFTVGAEYP
ncbi:MAG: hypothetical protein ACK45R_03365, partial [Candidatus Kapaibacterium sp.]